MEGLAPHFFTTRDWPLGASVGGDGGEAWAEIAAAVPVDVNRLIRVQQVHGAGVLVWRAGDVRWPARPQADIIINSDPAVALAVQSADCVPLLFVDQRTGAVAAAHAGWRGLAARVPRATVEALGRELGSRPVDLIVAVGPSIGACCYEVGADVRGRFEAAGFSQADLDRWSRARPQPTAANPSMAGMPSSTRPDHWYFDCWSATRDGLVEAGVPRAQIFSADLCTASHPRAFCSYRRDGSPAGRMAAVIEVTSAGRTSS